jgi:hypothetical protein
MIQSQMGEVFKSLVYSDFPEAWPGLLEAVYSHLTSHVRLACVYCKLRGRFSGGSRCSPGSWQLLLHLLACLPMSV